jgi:very-short-patch-repair endonuclease
MNGTQLPRQRMDFLLLPGGSTRVVIDLDGKHHYATDDGVASPPRYAEMVREDRRIRLGGYEVFRFGGGELQDKGGERVVREPDSGLA